MNYNYRSEEDLRELYVEKDYTQTEIGQILGVSTSTISDWMNRYDIETGNSRWSDISSENVEAVYDDSKTFTEMANGTKFGPAQIRKASIREEIHEPEERHEITYTDQELLEQIESVHEEKGFASKRLFESLEWTATVKAVRDHFGSWLSGVEQSAVQVSEHQKQSSSAPQTNSSRNYEKQRGSRTKYRTARQSALERDEYKCIECGNGSTNVSLHTHHIDQVNEFDDPNDAHYKENLVTLCKEHHNDVHANNIDCPEPPESE